MIRVIRLLCGVGMLVAVCGIGMAGDDVTKTGTFVWEREDKEISGDLKAVFTPRGDADNQWDVAFHFDWEDGPHVYRGTATGSLAKGKLQGEVVNDNEEHKSTFRFQGKFKKGKFKGTHSHIGEEGEPKPTGQLTLQ